LIKNIALIKGDGIGPEIIAEAVKVLTAIGERFGHTFEFTDVLMGGQAYDLTGEPLPKKTLEICKASDAVLLGAVGGPKWDDLPGDMRPEAGLLSLRKELGLYANIRPSKLIPALANACPLKIAEGTPPFDLVIVRELTGGAYFGEKKSYTDKGTKYASDLMLYSDFEVERICRIAFNLARKRRKKVVSVDKANVLESSRLWREAAVRVAKRYPDVEFSHMFVDNAAMQLVKNPGQFDVLVTENLFGDILSDEASVISGSLGMIPSASIGDTKCGLFEPIHGSAPDIAWQNKANPIGTILAAAMMLSNSFGMTDEGEAIEKAVEAVLSEGARTADIAETGGHFISCTEMGNKIAEKISTSK
jgi:3-isopropylmalate dehydrogenase